MKIINLLKYISPVFLVMMLFPSFDASAESTRAERKLIIEGNKLFMERKFADAAKKYEEALGVNASSAVGKYNLGVAQIRQVTNPQDTTPKNVNLLNAARQNLSSVASMAMEKPGLASKANYNLGNLEFNTKEYKKAIDYYKQALRINPNDESARKNLRIAQKQMQNQDQSKDNQDQNKDQNKDQNEDQNKDQNKDQNQDQNKDQNKDKNKDQKDQQPKEQQINPQTANQILQAMDNKESQTRARVNRANKGEKVNGVGGSRKKW